MKRLFALFLALVLSLTFVSCGNQAGDSTSSKDTGLTDDDNADSLRNKTFEGVTLKRILWYTMSDEEAGMVKDFEKKTGAKIENVVVDFENINTKIAASISAGDPIDIGWIYGAFFPTQVIAGMYEPINKYITKSYLVDSGSAASIAKGGFDISKMENYKWGNNYYGFCSYWDVDMIALYYRTDLFAESGIKTPLEYAKEGKWNLDTFYDVAKQLTNTNSGVYGFSSGGNNTAGYNPFVEAYGTQIVKYDSNGLPSQNLGDAAILEAFKFIQKISFGAGKITDASATFRNGKAAMSIDGLYEAPKMMNDSTVPNNVKNNWDIAPVPLAASNTSGAYPVDWLRATGIVKGSRNPDAVAAFALYKSQFKGDNLYEQYLTDAQKERVVPYYKKLNFANYAYGSMVDDYGKIFGRIATGDDISQLINEYKPLFKAQIDKVLNG